jgi:hypothetical protein
MIVKIQIPVYHHLCEKCGYLHPEIIQFGNCYAKSCPAKVEAEREKKH